MLAKKFKNSSEESQVHLRPEDFKATAAGRAQKESRVHGFREQFRAILKGEDKRLALVVGPCSIHNVPAALEYAHRLKALADKVERKIFIVMRAYFEKPRTYTGWRGLLLDPNLDESYDVAKGIALSRLFLENLADLGLPAATEFLNPLTPEFLADLITWTAVGARTVESQPHRQMASDLPIPVGFKNTLNGDIHPAVNAVCLSRKPQVTLKINEEGVAIAQKTFGNPDGHVVLRGSTHGPNYAQSYVLQTLKQLADKHLPERIMIDCGHGNRDKQTLEQTIAFEAILKQYLEQDGRTLFGMMLESYLKPGKQSSTNPATIQSDISITDPCLGWEATESLILRAAQKL